MDEASSRGASPHAGESQMDARNLWLQMLLLGHTGLPSDPEVADDRSLSIGRTPRGRSDIRSCSGVLVTHQDHAAWCTEQQCPTRVIGEVASALNRHALLTSCAEYFGDAGCPACSCRT